MTRSRARRMRDKKQRKPEQTPTRASLARLGNQAHQPVPRFSDLNTNPELPTLSVSPPISPRQEDVPLRSTTVRRAMRISRSFSGPLPPPELLVRYNEAVPDAANRILRMAEEQAQHRQKMEWVALTSDSRRANWGLVSGLVVALAFLAGSVDLGLNGHDQLAGVLGGATLISLVTVFVTGTISRNRERREQSQRAEGKKTRNSIKNPSDTREVVKDETP